MVALSEPQKSSQAAPAGPNASDKKFYRSPVGPIKARFRTIRRSCWRAFSLRTRELRRRGRGHKAGQRFLECSRAGAASG
jgi:hypothetical protein